MPNSVEYQRAWYAAHPGYAKEANRQHYAMTYSFMATIKLEAGCADCGYNESPVALDFDHVRGEKLFNIGLQRKGWPAILDEIDKCEVVCSNCHRIRTYEAKGGV